MFCITILTLIWALLSYLFSFMITMGFAIIVLFSMKGSLKNVEMVESLKSVE